MRKELLSSHFTNGETVAQEHLNKLPMSHSSQMERQNLNLDSWVPKLGFNPDNQWPEHGGLPSQAASCLRLEAPFLYRAYMLLLAVAFKAANLQKAVAGE